MRDACFFVQKGGEREREERRELHVNSERERSMLTKF